MVPHSPACWWNRPSTRPAFYSCHGNIVDLSSLSPLSSLLVEAWRGERGEKRRARVEEEGGRWR